MKKPIKLNKSDFYRVVLTDVLPYELPFIFTNEGYYHCLKSNILKNSSFLHKEIITKEDRKPFEYYIKKDKSSDRKLYLIHPSSQNTFIDVYKKYSSLITHLCSKSSYSLRAANSVASLYYESMKSKPHEKFKDEGVERECETTEAKYASSFFKYKKYDFLYKFYDSYEFHKIEKKFHSLLKLDISKCFDSISTGMLINSLRSEQIAKKAKNHNHFEREFSSALEQANFGRTHGIVIGPEFSRIFAEMILQAIDIKIKDGLNSKNIIEGRDYIVKRYVDDYFLFYNKESIRDNVLLEIKKQLEVYKLYCNESKYIQYNTPIITPVTSAKINIQDQLNLLFSIFDTAPLNSRDENEDDTPHHNISIIKSLNRHDLLANRVIRDIKCVVKDADVDFNSITGYFFTLIKIKTSELDNKYDFLNDDIQEERLCRFILIILELSFFIYSMDLRVRSTYLISQIIIILHRLSKRLREEKKERVLKKISDESRTILNYFINNKPVFNLEILNLLISLRVFFNNNQVTENNLMEIIGLRDDSANYFELMTGLFYIKNDKNFPNVRSKIIKKIKSKLNNENVFSDSELTHMLFDCMSCPYLHTKTKKNLIEIALKNYDLGNDNVENIYKVLSSNSWFIEWKNESSIIEKLLLKKELRTPYGN